MADGFTSQNKMNSWDRLAVQGCTKVTFNTEVQGGVTCLCLPVTTCCGNDCCLNYTTKVRERGRLIHHGRAARRCGLAAVSAHARRTEEATALRMLSQTCGQVVVFLPCGSRRCLSVSVIGTHSQLQRSILLRRWRAMQTKNDLSFCLAITYCWSFHPDLCLAELRGESLKLQLSKSSSGVILDFDSILNL